jgi:hypothetical protein
LHGDVYTADLLVRHVSLNSDRWRELIEQCRFVPFAVIELEPVVTGRSADRVAASAARLTNGAWIRTDCLRPGRRARWRGVDVRARPSGTLPMRPWQIGILAAIGAAATVASALLGGIAGDILGPTGSVVFGLAAVFGIEQQVLRRDRRRRSARAASAVLARASNAARSFGRQLARQLHDPESVLDSVASDVFDRQISSAAGPESGFMTLAELRSANSYRRHLHELRQADYAQYRQFVKDPRGARARVPWGEGRMEDLRMLGHYAKAQASAVADLSDLSRYAADLLEQPALLVQAFGLGDAAVLLAARAVDIDAYHSLPTGTDDADHARRFLRISPGHDDAAMRDGSAGAANPAEAVQWISGEMLNIALQSWTRTIDIVRVAIMEQAGSAKKTRPSAPLDGDGKHPVSPEYIDRRIPVDHHDVGGSRPSVSEQWLEERERTAAASWAACSFRRACRGATEDGTCLSCLSLLSPESARALLVERAHSTIDLRGAAVTIQLLDLVREVFADGCDARLELSWTVWPRYADFSCLDLRKEVDLQHAIIPSWVSFHGTAFMKASFASAEFGTFVSFARTRFRGATSFRDSCMAAGATFADASSMSEIDITDIRGETKEIKDFARRYSNRPPDAGLGQSDELSGPSAGE